MNPAPAVAVVMAVHNNEPYVAAALDSVLAQTHTAWACTVVDDASTDDTAEVVKRYLDHPRITLRRRAERGGSAAARNTGLASLPEGCELIAFLDGDDLWLPDALAVLVEALSSRPDVVGVYGLAEYIDAAGEPLRPGEHPRRQRDRRRVAGLDLADVAPDEDATFASMVISGPIWPSGVALHRREVVERAGGFDPRLRLQQDWDLYLRMSRHGNFGVVDRQVAWYRQHTTNVTHRTVDRVFHQDAVRRKTWVSPENTLEQRQVAARAWRALQHRRVLASGLRALATLRVGSPRAAATALVATIVLTLQLLAPGPPAPSRRLLHLTGREN